MQPLSVACVAVDVVLDIVSAVAVAVDAVSAIVVVVDAVDAVIVIVVAIVAADVCGFWLLFLFTLLLLGWFIGCCCCHSC